MHRTTFFIGVVCLFLIGAQDVAAECSYGSGPACKMVPCGTTFCLVCPPPGSGGGNLDCPGEVRPASAPVPTVGSGDLIELPEIAGWDFAPVVNAMKSGASIDPTSGETFRLYLETGNQALERFRVDLEKNRADGRVPLDRYHQGISDYHRGIEAYRGGMSIVEGFPR